MALAPVATLSTGCQSPHQVVAAKTLEGVGISVRAGMQTYAQMVKAGKVSPEAQARVAELHDAKFLPVYNAAVAIVANDLSQKSPLELSIIASDLLLLIDQLSQ